VSEINTNKPRSEFIVSIKPVEYHSEPSSANLHLPASQNDFIDALDRARAANTNFFTELQDSKRKFLLNILDDSPDVFELNHLAERLALLDESESLFFEAMFKLEKSPPNLARLINITHNLGGCVLNSASNLHELGKFAVDGGFFPEFDDLPESLLQYLNYEALGSRFKDEQNGIMLDGLFVANLDGDNDFKMLYNRETVKYSLSMNNRFQMTIECISDDGNKVQLSLPTAQYDMNRAAIAMGKHDLTGCRFENCRSSIPKLNESLTGNESIYELNDLAEYLQMHSDNGDLPKYKAALEFAGFSTLTGCIELADNLGTYEYHPDMVSDYDYGEWELIGEYKLDAGCPGMEHFDFAAFGKDRMAAKGTVNTPYGYIRKTDVEQDMAQQNNLGMGMSLN
jgi:hypothetical protein